MEKAESGWVRRHLGITGPAAQAEPEEPEAPARVLKTFFNDGAQFNGILRLRESFRIEGEFRGEIVSEGTLIVGEAAGVEANLCAREVIVAGAVVGRVAASRQIIIRSGGRVHGDLETPCLQIEKGAVHNGGTRMVRPEDSARARALAEAGPGEATRRPRSSATQPVDPAR